MANIPLTTGKTNPFDAAVKIAFNSPHTTNLVLNFTVKAMKKYPQTIQFSKLISLSFLRN
jgi:hypothetical protein